MCPGASAWQDLRAPLGVSQEESQDLSELHSRKVLTGTFSPFRTRKGFACSPGFAHPGSSGVPGCAGTVTVTSCSFPVLPRAGESIFPPLGQPELPFPRRGEIAQRLRATA